MDDSRSKPVLDEMLEKLALARQSMEKQASSMAEIAEKSNYILVKIETSRKMRPPSATVQQAQSCSYSKDTVQVLAQIIEQYQQMLSCNKSKSQRTTYDSVEFENYLQANKQRIDYVGSSVRKLLAVSDAVAEMKATLLDQEGCYDSD